MTFYAHSGVYADLRDGQLLAEHLQNVAAMARANATNTALDKGGLPDASFSAGLLHDLGKYRKGFQTYLRQLATPREDRLHKQAGAAKAAAWKSDPIAFAIFGHHGGLPDKSDLQAGLKSTATKAFAEACPHDSRLARLKRPGIRQEFSRLRRGFN